jgi:hypothetical protein
VTTNGKLDYMPFFGRDFYFDDKVKVLTDRQEAWYMRLLWHQWEHGVVPLDEQLCRSIAKPEFYTKAQEWQQFHQKIETLFPATDESHFEGANPKVEAVRAKSVAVMEAKRKGGRTRAKQLWGDKDTNEDSNEDSK